MRRGTLRLYLGAAPGVGKTFAMLNEGWRRRNRGADVVIGVVETHGRAHTGEQIRDLEVAPRRELDYRGVTVTEMDVDAVLARQPKVALVDELAHSNVPGSRHAKRWEDVDELLDAGIDVISTLNLQHLESVNDVVERITGVPQRETVPDAVVRRADQIELVDMAPEALRRRLAHGNVYPPERVDTALSNFFRVGNLSALRELALLWVADRVEDGLQDYRERHGIDSPWETRERVVVSITGAPGSDHLVRRAARMAARSKGELIGVHVRSEDAVGDRTPETLARRRRLLEELGGRFVEVVGADVPKALVHAARAENATQLVLGASRRSAWAHLWRGSIVSGAVRHAAGDLDVHVIGADPSERAAPAEGRRAGRWRLLLEVAPVPVRRQASAVALGLMGFPLLTFVLTGLRDHLDLSVALSAYLLLVVAVALIGGMWPAALAAAAGFLLSNYFFAPPIHTFTIGDVRDVLALLAFLVIAGVVSALVDRSARRALASARAVADVRALARLASRLATPSASLPSEFLEEIRATFRQTGAAVVDRGGGAWRVLERAGDDVPARAAEAETVAALDDDDLVLALRGPTLRAEDRETLSGFAAQLAAARRLRATLPAPVDGGSGPASAGRAPATPTTPVAEGGEGGAPADLRHP